MFKRFLPISSSRWNFEAFPEPIIKSHLIKKSKNNTQSKSILVSQASNNDSIHKVVFRGKTKNEATIEPIPQVQPEFFNRQKTKTTNMKNDMKNNIKNDIKNNMKNDINININTNMNTNMNMNMNFKNNNDYNNYYNNINKPFNPQKDEDDGNDGEKIVSVIKSVQSRKVLSPEQKILILRLYFGRPGKEGFAYLLKHFQVPKEMLGKILDKGRRAIQQKYGDRTLKAIDQIGTASFLKAATDDYFKNGSDSESAGLPDDYNDDYNDGILSDDSNRSLSKKERDAIIDDLFPAPQGLDSMASAARLEHTLMQVPVSKREQEIMQDIVSGQKYQSLISAKRFSAFQPSQLAAELKAKASANAAKRSKKYRQQGVTL